MGGDYGKVLRSFWTDPDIKRVLTPEQKELLLYYFTSPHGNLAGLYYSPFEYVAAETGLPLDRVREWTMGALARFVTYDERTEEVLVHRGARHQVGDELKAGDKRVKALQKVLAETHSHALVERFHSLYPEWPFEREPVSQFDTQQAPSKPLESPFEAKAVTVAVTEQIPTTVAKATGGEPPEEEEPAGEPERPGTPHTPNQPDPEAEFRRHRADIAGAIREHAWLRRAPPPIRRRGGQPWEMDNELSIAKELLKQFTAEELIGGIQFWRRTHGTPEGEQFSLAFCYKDGERWKISLAVDSWQHAEEDGAPVVDLLAKLKLGGHDAAA